MPSTGFPNDSTLSQSFAAAIQSFWDTRDRQQQAQVDRGVEDAGSRGAVTGGKQMLLVENLVSNLIERAGVPCLEIYKQKKLELPGFYRPEKKWDLIVVSKETLICAIEFKSLIGPSFGNNANNRIEEALGSASDISIAYREGRFGIEKPRPLLGYFFILEDCPAVNLPVLASEPHFPIDPAFKFVGQAPESLRRRGGTLGASYNQRFQLFIRRLVLERVYDAACLTLSTRGAASQISHPAGDLAFKQFALSLYTNAEKFAGLLS